MNDYEQKLADRRQYYRDKAAQAREDSEQLYTNARKMAEVIPFGQPILVGHHSERSDRNFRQRIENKYRAAYEASKKADYYEERAKSVGKGGISSDDPQAIEKLEEKIIKAQTLQDLMKAANKAIRLKDTEKGNQRLTELGFSEQGIAELRTPDFAGRLGFPGYELTNNNANIRRMKQRIEELERMSKVEDTEVECENGVTYAIEDNRVCLYFPGKPPRNIREIVKLHGFKWSRYNERWQRKLTENALFFGQEVIKALNNAGPFECS